MRSSLFSMLWAIRHWLRTGPSHPKSSDDGLAGWLVRYCQSEEYRSKVALFRTEKRLTPAAEVAALVGLIEHMKPQRVLEIGTFFGQTTRPMSEAVGKSGKLITIDPFGGHRVPDLLRQWPAELQAVTEFQPINSMEFFQSFERTALDSKEELDLVFIDGNHQFAYALFDITSAAINIKPGGVLVIDNVEQDDVRLAMLQFLAVNPAWQIVFNGRTWSASEITISDLRLSYPSRALWAALFAPRDIQIGPTGGRFAGRTSGNAVLCGVELNIARIDAPQLLTVTLAYSAVPFDYHLTGRGEKKAIRVTTGHLPIGKTNAEILFDEPLRLNDCENCNFFYEINLSLEKDYFLLSSHDPVRLIFTAK